MDIGLLEAMLPSRGRWSVQRGGVTLVFPPLWYYTSVPADLSYTGALVAAAGVPVRLVDLSARFARDALGLTGAWALLRREATYADPATRGPLMAELKQTSRQISARHKVRYRPRMLRFGDFDEADVFRGRKVGLSGRNPALPTLREATAEIVAANPAVVGIALVYPEQRVQVLTLARLLRRAGFDGAIVLYGSLQDEIAPEDFVPDLVGDPLHSLFEDVDGVVAGEAGSALAALHRYITGKGAIEEVPNLVWARKGLPEPPATRFAEDLTDSPIPDFSHIEAECYATPTPVVDLRMGRGCPWGRCAFCAIQAHHPGYRPGVVTGVAQAMAMAHTQLGSTYFRIRDDLVTPRQLGELADAVAALDFRAHWSVRARFQPGWSSALLAKAAAAGLDEMWLGLESASERVRERMVKGVPQEVVVRNLHDLHAAGIRVRALCMLGFPGETEAEANQTVDFVLDHLDQLATASLSPFMLMRRSPMVANPERWDLSLRGDPLPRFARLRFTQKADWPGRLDKAAFRRIAERAQAKLGAHLERELCPDATHGWMRAVATRT